MCATRAEGAARFAAGLPENYTDMSWPVRCVVRTDVPPYLPTIYNNNFQIFQGPGYVTIAPEMIHSARIIPLDGRPHLNKGLRQWLGERGGCAPSRSQSCDVHDHRALHARCPRFDQLRVHRANGRDLTLPNGQTLFLGSSSTGAPYDKK